MAEGIDEAAGEFGKEIAPQIKPRDQQGKYIRETAKPEPMFELRPVEGDPDTGDTSDGGDDERLRARERSVQRRRAEPEPDEEPEPETFELGPSEDDEGGEPETRESDDGEKYEVTVDGETHEVSLEEALNGYIRQATFHKRMADLNGIQANMEADASKLQHGWAIWNKARLDYEEDLTNLIPKEPDWDQEYARDPRTARGNQKVYETLYSKLAMSRQSRAEREAANAEEADRRLQKYAVDSFARFVAMHPKVFPDEPALRKNIQSMRRTAMAAGFSEREVATVYDPRMLTILLKASKYDRMQAANPKAVVPGKGRTLPPGSATPLSGNATRKGLDEAQRRLASSGRLDDAADVFRRLL